MKKLKRSRKKLLERKKICLLVLLLDLDIHSKNKETKMTPFLYCLLNKEHDVLKIFLIKYKDSVNIYDNTADGMSMLHLLAFLHELKRDGERILLAYPNLPINEKEKKNSFTPLHFSVINGNLEIVFG
ncbi:hypothetical protein M9Y10_038673 [Tritrichomonas musculus]|uniref:Ankyrin repeat protein n=1 Tax=Tritrichomonas musculus TaxID=1915356 RepID=A0ABR2K929_9EUKA